MDKYVEKLISLSESIGNVQAISFAGYDGISIYEHKIISSADVEILCAKLATVIKNIQDLESNSKEIIIISSKNIIIIKLLIDGFIFALMSPDGNIGRAKMGLNKLEGNFCG